MLHISKQEVESSLATIAILREQNTRFFGSEDYSHHLRLLDARNVERIPSMQEFVFQRVEAAARFFDEGDEAFLTLTPAKVAIAEGAQLNTDHRELYASYKTLQEKKPLQFHAEGSEVYNEFSRQIKSDIKVLKEIAAERQLIDDYVTARREFRRVKEGLGATGDIEGYLKGVEAHDSQRCASILKSGYNFEGGKGEFLKLETQRMAEEAKLYQKFFDSYQKAKSTGMLKDFLPALGLVYNGSDTVRTDWVNLTEKAGGVAFIKGEGYSQNTALRADGYEGAYKSMHAVSGAIDKALKEVEGVQQQREAHSQSLRVQAKESLFGKVLNGAKALLSKCANAVVTIAAMAGIGASETNAQPVAAIKPVKAPQANITRHAAVVTEITTIEITAMASAPNVIRLTSVKQAVAMQISQNAGQERA